MRLKPQPSTADKLIVATMNRQLTTPSRHNLTSPSEPFRAFLHGLISSDMLIYFAAEAGKKRNWMFGCQRSYGSAGFCCGKLYVIVNRCLSYVVCGLSTL